MSSFRVYREVEGQGTVIIDAYSGFLPLSPTATYRLSAEGAADLLRKLAQVVEQDGALAIKDTGESE